ncbi:uncharacterized protein LOC115679852 [Syzygium oleosum]|uniref:uncharacterized protein LOC115679852 n=1 Tax=Syzygium oleosum TaxID=219896 RepID=UPI0011D17F12|nr:uncharacterized protein LOC115679852 [Syzygium oleosum]
MELLHWQVLAPSQWRPSPSPLSPRESRNLASRLPPNPTLLFFHRRRRTSPTLVARCGGWDFNAENRGPGGFGYGPRGGGDGVGGFGKWVRRKEKGRKKGWWRCYGYSKRRWWSDDDGDEDEDEEEEPVGIWEEVIDTFWILKVFRSYGWMLPIILISLLVATGPKAFLITLALFFGQSALALVIKKLWPGKKNKSKGKAGRRRRKRYPYRTNNIRTKEERDWRRWNRKDKIEYESQQGEGDFSAPEYEGDTNSFGGWDELEGKQFTGKSYPVSERPQRPQMDIGKYSRKASRDDVPLLMRLLIAMFPFLGSWTKMFW